MKQIFFALLLIIVVFCSCSVVPSTREIEICLPLHPWEKNSTKSMWYSVKWNSEESMNSLRLNSKTNSAKISIPLGQTTYICAYPLDELNPLGVIIDPYDDRKSFTLNENEGALAGYLINLDGDITRIINSKKLYENALNCTKDFRTLDYIVLLKDILNGELSENSFKKTSKKAVSALAIPDGYWIAENTNDHCFEATEEKTPILYLPYGTYAWYCPSLDLEYFICIDEEGKISSSTRSSKLT